MDTKEKIKILKAAIQNFTEEDFETIDKNLLDYQIPIDYSALTYSVRSRYNKPTTDIVVGSKVMITTGYPSFKIGYVYHINDNDRCTIEKENDNRHIETRYKSELILLS